ncbi:MAG: nitroreductase family protein [Gammaproteobacteria bacterium]|nr:nitroreductase family protein [Gammaproteobacteria bacterium]
MNVGDALLKRKSTRAFSDREVSLNFIREILDAARHAPSGVNTQPWQVAVVTGEKKRSLCSKMEEQFRTQGKGTLDYSYYPDEWIDPYRGRRKSCGLQMYSTLNIAREDKQKQLDQWAANYRAFDAPVALFFFIDPVLNTGSYIDYGLFLQSIMLVAVEKGLATCPQAALGEFPDIVKGELGYSQECILIGGMALGYEDKGALVNSYRTDRQEVDEFTRFFE